MANGEVSSSSMERIKLVVFGASGFTGQFVVEELARMSKDNKMPSWAVAGRSMEKLQSVLAEASKQTGKNVNDVTILIADVNNEQSLNEMCKRAKVVLNCVGPYRFFGEKVVKACVENGAHHVDISGEPQFLEQMQLKYNEAAREAGVYVVGSCGFDSIPADLGVEFTKLKFDGDLNSVENFLRMKTGPEGGVGHYATWQSAIHGFANAADLVRIRKELFPTPMPKITPRMKRRGNLFYSKEVDAYCIPFPGSDRSVVNRSQRYNYEVRKERPVQFSPYVMMPSMFATMMLIFFGAVFALMAKFSFGRTLLEKYPKLFSCGAFSHDGPTRKQMKDASFSWTFYGSGFSDKIADVDQQHEGRPDKTIVTKVSGPEPGYVATPICIIQAAMVILEEADQLPKGGGVFPPGAAFAKTTLIERLNKNDVKFEVIES